MKVGLLSSLTRTRRGERSAVVKTAQAGNDVLDGLRVHERETGFYSDLATRLPVRVPECYEAGNPLVLEDLAVWSQPDQITGVDRHLAERIVVESAKLHARFWQNPALRRLPWLPGLDDAPFQHLVVQARERWERFVVQHEPPAPAVAGTGRFLARADHLLMTWQATRPYTLIHGDLRAANVMVAPDGASVAFIDFHLVARAPGPVDLGHFVCGSMTDASESLNELLALYYRQLLSEGITNYSMDECRLDMRIGLLLALLVNIVFATLPADEPARKARREVARRYFDAASWSDAFGLVG